MKNSLVRASCLLVLWGFIFPAGVFGQTKLWDKAYGGTEFDDFAAVISTPDGGYLLGGSSSSPKGNEKTENSRGGTDFWIVKTDGFGNKQWDKTIGGNGNDYLGALVATPDGGYLLGGSSGSNVSGDKTAANIRNCDSLCALDFWIVKVDGRGQKQWDKTFGDSILFMGEYDDIEEEITTMLATPDGGFLLGGTPFYRRYLGMWVVKIDSTGNQQWISRYPPLSIYGKLSAIAPASDGGYMLGGTDDPVNGNTNFWLVRIDNTGNFLWQKSLGGNSFDELQALVGTPDGGYLLGGYSYSDKGGDKSEGRRGECNEQNVCFIDYWVVKTDSLGYKLWDKTLGGASDDVLTDLTVTKDGHYLIGGNSTSGIGFDKSEDNQGANDYWVLMLDKQGRKLWDKTVGGKENDFLYSVTRATDAGYLLAGSSTSNIDGDKSETSRGMEDYWLVKLTEPDAPACTALGAILREHWRGIKGIRVRDFSFSTPPTSMNLLTLFEGPANIGQEYASRIRGYICAPQTGHYTFWIAGDNETQLWLSPDDDPANKVMIAGHLTWTQPRGWFESINQQSVPVPLVAGKRYYIEALHKEGTREDHVAVAWRLPDGTMEAPIPGSRLSPFGFEILYSSMADAGSPKEPATRDHPGAELQAFPNPFSTTTTLAFTSPEDAEAVLEILSLQGSLVQTLFRGKVMADTVAQYELEGSRLANGVYLARLVLNGKVSYQRLVVNK